MGTVTPSTEIAQTADSSEPETAAADSGRAHQRRQHPYIVLAVVLTATFMQLVDVSIVNVAVKSIQVDIGASFANIQLILAGYQLAFAITLITASRLGDLFGRRKVFMLGMAGFVLASAACGAAPNAGVLVIGRVVQGLMSGLMFAQVLAVIQVTFEPKERGKAFGVFGATIGMATILGPLLGGVLIAWNPAGLDWRTIFYVNVPIGAVALVVAFFRLPDSRSDDAQRLDVPGAVLIAAALFLLVFPLTEGRERGWPTWVIVMLVASVPMFLGFVAYQLRKTRRRDSPLLNMHLFADRGFRTGSLLGMVFFAGLPPFFLILTLYLQIGFGYTPLHAGLTTFAFAIGSGVASAQSDRLAKRIGKATLAVGCIILLGGTIGLIFVIRAMGDQLHWWAISPVLLVCGVGLGLFVAPFSNAVLQTVRKQLAGSASGALATVQQLGGALGVALVGIVLFGLLPHNSASAADAVIPQLRRDLAAAGLPAAAQQRAIAGFRQCLKDRTSSSDPSNNPPSCRRAAAGAAGPSAAKIGAAFRSAGVDALKRDFSTSVQQTLLYEVAAFGLALLVVPLLPGRPRGKHALGRREQQVRVHDIGAQPAPAG